MGEWDTAYSAITALAGGDDFLVRQLSATPPAAGTIRRITTTDLRNALVPALPSFAVNDYGADPTGVADSTAAFSDAYAAAAATLTGGTPGAYVTMGPGAYKVTAGSLTASDPRIGLLGPGSSICTVNASGSGDVFYHYTASFSTSGGGSTGLAISGFTIDGTSTTGAANGIHVRDICELELHDLQVRNFTQAGSAGLYFDGLTGWSERLLFLRVRTSNCVIGTRFTSTVTEGGTSFDYMRCLDLYANIQPGQIGVQLDSFAQLDQATFFFSYNCNAQAAGADQTALMIGPTNGSTETSRIINALLDVRGEKDGSGSNCFDIHIGSFANLSGTGVLLGSGMDAGTLTSGSVFVSGYINTPAFTANHQLFALPGGWACYTGDFYGAPATKGLSFLDQTLSGNAVKTTVISGSGNPNGGSYFSIGAGDLFLRPDAQSTPNAQLYVAQGASSNVWQPVVAAAIASGSVSLTAGSATVANTSITTSSIIRVFNVSQAGTVGALSVSLTAGTSFTIHSTSGTDTSKVYWEVVSY